MNQINNIAGNCITFVLIRKNYIKISIAVKLKLPQAVF